MKADCYFIPNLPVGRLAIMPRPRAGDWLEDEVVSWRQSGLQVIVSLLQDSETKELSLEDEASQCERAGLTFLRLPIPDRGLPTSSRDVSRLVDSITARLSQGHGVGIHCRIGVGRAAVIAACVLGAMGVQLDVAWSHIEKARGLSVPDTPEQKAWVASWLRSLHPKEPT